MSVRKVPGGILCKIFSHLAGDYQTLANIALVSRLFKDCVYPILWQIISFHSEPSSDLPMSSFPPPNKSLAVCRRLLDVLRRDIDERGVALNVKTLITSCPTLDQDDAADVQNQLLNCLPKLRKLSMDPPPPWLRIQRNIPLEVAKMDFKYYVEVPSNQKQSVRSPGIISLVGTLASVPSLRILDVTNACFGAFFPLLSIGGEYRFSFIEELRLRRCYSLGSDAIPGIISWSKTLRVLVLELLSFQKCFLDRLFPTLQYHENQLETFILVTAISTREPLFEELKQSFDEVLRQWNFTNFLALKKLALPFDPCISQRATSWKLPPRLEVLQVQHRASDKERNLKDAWNPTNVAVVNPTDDRLNAGTESLIQKKFEELFQYKHVATPMLKRIIWWRRVDRRSTETSTAHLQILKGIEQNASQADVSFECVQSQALERTPLGGMLTDWD